MEKIPLPIDYLQQPLPNWYNFMSNAIYQYIYVLISDMLISFANDKKYKLDRKQFPISISQHKQTHTYQCSHWTYCICISLYMVKLCCICIYIYVVELCYIHIYTHTVEVCCIHIYMYMVEFCWSWSILEKGLFFKWLAEVQTKEWLIIS